MSSRDHEQSTSSSCEDMLEKAAKVSIRLDADSGYEATIEARINALQWGVINDVIDRPDLYIAAPDLLEALKDARAQLEGYEQHVSGEAYNDPRINAAIAKAEGRS